MVAIPLPNMPEGGLYMNAKKIGNALQRQNLENQYYGPLAQADMTSKVAYAQYRPAEIAATMMQNPAFRQLPPAQQTEMIQRYANSLAQPAMQMPSVQPSRGDKMLNAFWDMISGNKGGQQPQNAVMQPPGNAAPQNALIQQPGLSPEDQQRIGAMQPGDAYKVQGNQPKAPGYATPSARQDAGLMTPGSAGAAGPIDAAERDAAAAKAARLGQTSNQNAQQKERSVAASKNAQLARSAIQALEAADRNYQKSTYKGQYAGSRPSSGEGSIPTAPGHNSAPEQLTDSYINEAITSLTGLGDSPAGSTDLARGVVISGKPSRSMDEEAWNEKVHSTKAKLSRIENYRHFINDFYKNNPNGTDEDLVGLMNLYDQYAPPYDYENGKELKENNKKFKDFTSQKALAEYQANGDYNPYENKQQEVNNDPSKKAGAAAKILAKDVKFPKFNSEKEFGEWASQQSEPVLKAYSIHRGWK